MAVKPKARNNCLFNTIVLLTDFNCDLANASVNMRLQNVFHYLMAQAEKRTTLPKEIKLTKTAAKRELPPLVNVEDIPAKNVDYGSYALYSAFRALGRSGPNMFIHVTDATNGDRDDRCVMVTDWGNTFIGPNNGSLGLMAEFFRERGIAYTMYKIDVARIEEFEQHRMEEPTYHLPRNFHGRDVFAVVAALLASGVKVNQICDKLESNMVAQRDFSDNMIEIPSKLREKTRFFAFREHRFGHLKTNIMMDALTFDQLTEEDALFRISYRNPQAKWWQKKTKAVKFTVGRVFDDAKQGDTTLCLGNTFAPAWDARFTELALTPHTAKERLNLPERLTAATSLVIERLK